MKKVVLSMLMLFAFSVSVVGCGGSSDTPAKAKDISVKAIPTDDGVDAPNNVTK